MAGFLTWLANALGRLRGRSSDSAAPAPAAAAAARSDPRFVVDYTRVVVAQTQSEAMAAVADARTLAIVNGDDGPKWLILICPCGCHEPRRVSLSPRVSPAWRLKVEPGPLVSLRPSVFLARECRAHFILSRNRALVI